MMKYRIIADSGCDLFSKDLSDETIDFITVPLTIAVGEQNFLDEESFDIRELLAAMKAAKGASKTACPSPQAFEDEMDAYDNVICVTLSSKLSGTYDSASLAMRSVKERYPEKNIFVLDSFSASAGIDRILHELSGLIKSGLYTFDEIAERITQFRNSSKTKFMLHDLGNLIKSGRMNKVVGLVASALNIKLILGDNGEGEIKMFNKILGGKKAIEKLSAYPEEKAAAGGAGMPVVISHCFNEEDAGIIKDLLEKKLGLTNVKTYLMRGIAGFYANLKGIILAY